ncbi:unnamed protein product [Caenorhabditis nigoni]
MLKKIRKLLEWFRFRDHFANLLQRLYLQSIGHLSHNPEDDNIRWLQAILLHLMRRNWRGELANRYSRCLVRRFPLVEELNDPAADQTALLYQAWRAISESV